MSHGAKPYQHISHNYANTNVVTSSWTMLSGSTLGTDSRFTTIFDSCGETVKIGYASSGSASIMITEMPIKIPPGGFDGMVPLYIKKDNAIFLKANTATIGTGNIEVTLYG